MKNLISIYLFLFLTSSFAQDNGKGIPPVAKITPTPTATPMTIPTKTPVPKQSTLKSHETQHSGVKMSKQDKQAVKDLEKNIETLNTHWYARSITCPTLKINLDEKDFMTSHHRLYLLFGQVDPSLTLASADCQVCMDAQKATQDYLSCLLKDDPQTFMLGTEFKTVVQDPLFYNYVQFRLKVDDTTIQNMKKMYDYLLKEHVK